MIAPLVLAAALQSATAQPAVGTFVDPTSKEELLTLESGGKVQVFYAAVSGKHRQELTVKGELYGSIFQINFRDPTKKYVIEWTKARDVITCANPDGTQERFVRVDVDRAPFKSPEAAVRALYFAFPEEAQFHSTLNLAKVSADERALYLAPKLAAAFEAQLADGFEADPLYDAQDLQVTNFKVGSADRAHAVPVTFENHGKKQTFKVLVEKSATGWQVADIQYDKTHSLAGVLAESAKNRAPKSAISGRCAAALNRVSVGGDW